MKKNKRIFVYLLLLFLFIGGYGIKKTLTESFAVPINWYLDYTNSINETNNTITLTKYNGTDSTVYVPATASINGKNYKVIINGKVYEDNKKVESITFEDNVKVGSRMDEMFCNCSNLKTINFNKIDTSDVTDISAAFARCDHLESIDFSNFDTSKVTRMEKTFAYSTISGDLDLSSFNTSNVTNMSEMFRYGNFQKINFANWNTEKLTKLTLMFANSTVSDDLDLSSFDTSKVTDMTGAFRDGFFKKINLSSWTTNGTNLGTFFCLSKIEGIDISNFDTDSSTDIYSIFNGLEGLTEIKIGPKFNMKTSSSAVFGRGSWKRIEDGKIYSIPELREITSQGLGTGTYTKISNMSKQTNIDFTVDYKIDFIKKIDELKTNRSDIYQLADNKLYAKFPVQSGESQLPGYAELLFKDVVSDRNNNKYNLKMIIKDIVYSNLSNSQSNYNIPIIQILDDGLSINSNAAPSIMKYGITIQVVNNSDEVQNGKFIFSAYDLDIPQSGGGYGLQSEGINLGTGFDLSTLKISNPTFIQIINNTRLTGTTLDNDSEMSEFVIQADANGAKFDWTVSNDARTKILSYYQPRNVEIVKQDDKGNNLSGAELKLYYNNNLVESWTSTNSSQSFFLMPGQYTIKEIESPAHYMPKSEEIIFFVDIEDKLTIDGVSQDKIKVINSLKKYPLTVNYYDKKTGELLDSKEFSDKEYGSVINSLDYKIDIDKYTYDSCTPNSITISATGNVINLYYVKKTGKVIIKYLDKITNNPVSTDDTLTGNVDDGYTTSSKTISGYVLDSDSGNTTGIYKLTDQEVIYYYIKSVKLTVNHYVDGTTTPVKLKNGNDAQSEVRTLKQNDPYETSSVETADYYELKETPVNATGTMGSSDVVVTYYYKLTNNMYQVNYLEKGTNKILETPKIASALYGTVITASSEVIEIDKYTYDSCSPNSITISATGNVINLYYVKKTGKVIIKYLDKITNNPVSTDDTLTGNVDDEYTTIPKAIDNYVLDSDSGNTTGTYKLTDQEVIYYYRKVFNIITMVVGEGGTITGDEEVLEGNDSTEGKIVITPSNGYEIKTITINGDDYPISNKDGMVLDQIRDIHEGKVIVVSFKRKTYTLKVNYIDEVTNRKLSDEIVTIKQYQDAYETERKQFDNYRYIRVVGNERDVILRDTEVTYYYHKLGKVTVRHINKTTNEVMDVVNYEGLVGEEYTSSEKTFAGYVLFTKPDVETKDIVDGELVFIYYYKKISSGLVEKHIDEYDNTLLERETIHQGNVGDEYNIESKEFTGYDLDRNKIPTNKEGRLKDELIEVLYYYKKKAKVIVKYIDEETGEEIALSEEINGYYGDDYQSSEKEIENYNLIKTPENPSGIMNSGEKELIYYYHKIFKVLTFVENSGGTIEGDEKVLEGYDSTINRIRIKADKNHYIVRITINGEDIAITNKQSMILENFINMHEDKNIVVKFGEIVHNVPKTSKNSISLILVIIIFMSGLMIAYFACKNKRTSF